MPTSEDIRSGEGGESKAGERCSSEGTEGKRGEASPETGYLDQSSCQLSLASPTQERKRRGSHGGGHVPRLKLQVRGESK